MHPDPLGGGLADERFGDLGEASGIGEEVGFGVPGPIDRDLRCDGQVQSSVDPVYGHGNTGSVGSLGEEGGSDRGRGRASEEIHIDRFDRNVLIDEQTEKSSLFEGAEQFQVGLALVDISCSQAFTGFQEQGIQLFVVDPGTDNIGRVAQRALDAGQFKEGALIVLKLAPVPCNMRGRGIGT